MNRDITPIKKLIASGRYEEARLMLRETQHPQVAKLEEEITELIEGKKRAERPPIISRSAVLSGMVAGSAFFLFFAAKYHYQSIAYFALCGILVAFVVMIFPEYTRRRYRTADYFTKKRLEHYRAERRRD